MDFTTANSSKKYIGDLSFNYILWRRIQQIKDEEILLKDLDDKQIRQLSFTILPGGKFI